MYSKPVDAVILQWHTEWTFNDFNVIFDVVGPIKQVQGVAGLAEHPQNGICTYVSKMPCFGKNQLKKKAKSELSMASSNGDTPSLSLMSSRTSGALSP